jgi:hypothetical protein
MIFFHFKNNWSPTLKFINEVIGQIVETEIYMQFMKRRVHNVKLAKSTNISKITYSYIYINVTHMHAVSYVLLLGYALAVLCVVMDITLYHLVSKGRVSLGAPLFMEEYKYKQLIGVFVYSRLSSSSSYIYHLDGPLVDPFRSHVTRSLFNGQA